MKKLRERLNKKGFTLVELIVVIVIILILAAALVPNVMRYIGQAREASFKSDASAYLVEIQGYAAETYAKYDKDLGAPISVPGVHVPGSSVNVTQFLVGVPGSSNPSAVGAYIYPLSGFKTTDTASYANAPLKAEVKHDVGTKEIKYAVYHGAVTDFTYTDGKYAIGWSQTAGWDKELTKK